METFLIGSLPFKDVEQALELSFSLSIPTLPTLPHADKNEFMLEQIRTARDGDLFFLAERAFFAKLAGFSLPFYKWQACGPYTVAKSLEDFKSYELANKVRATQERFNRQSTARPIFFVDEPMLGFGGDKGALTLLGDFLKELKNSIAFSGALFGLHCCSKVSPQSLLGLKFDLFALDAGLYSAKEWSSAQALLKERLVYIACDSSGAPSVCRRGQERYASSACGQGLSSPQQAATVARALRSVF